MHFPEINRKSRVLHPGPGFLSSAIWPSLPRKHHNGLINQLINIFHILQSTNHTRCIHRFLFVLFSCVESDPRVAG